MRHVITKKDIRSLCGKYVVELDDDNPDATITEGSWDFWKEKRISFVVGRSFHGFMYTHHTADTDEEFVEWFNGIGRKRFFRLLTTKELMFLFDKMAYEIY